MVGLYVASTGRAAGKSAICAGLGRELKAGGSRVGYLKPVSSDPGGADKDAELMKQILSLEEPAASLCPVSLGVKDLAATVEEASPAWLKKIEEAYAGVSRGKDVVLLEGMSDIEAGSGSARVAGRVVDALKAKAILLVYYRGDLDAGRVAEAAKTFGEGLFGVVINGVPQGRMRVVKGRMVPSLEQSGVRVLGVLPENRALFTVTVAELAEHIGGHILNSQERSNELVESLIVGGLSFDSALSYLTPKSGKAVITRGDHADIQMAALNSSAVCLVLTENIDPNPTILSRAQAVQTPIILVDKDTTGTMDALEGLFDGTGFFHERKLERLAGILDEHLDLEAVYQAI